MEILSKDAFTEEDINSIIENKVEESINIEFKSSQALAKDNGSKKELSKDVSSMANSDGGVIIYGIMEASHVASALSFVDGREITKEWIEDVIGSNIQQRISGIKIFPVRFGGDLTKTVYVVQIPRSPNGPHMMRDKVYYKRFNFQSCPMEEYEVRNSYFRIDSGALELAGIKIGRFVQIESKFVAPVFIDVLNNGTAVAEKYKVGAWIKADRTIDYTFDRFAGYDTTIDFDYGFKISTSKSSIIFPLESLTALVFKVEIPKYLFREPAIEAKIKVLLFCPGFNDEQEYDLGELLIEARDKFFDYDSNYT